MFGSVAVTVWLSIAGALAGLARETDCDRHARTDSKTASVAVALMMEVAIDLVRSVVFMALVLVLISHLTAIALRDQLSLRAESHGRAPDSASEGMAAYYVLGHSLAEQFANLL